MPQEESHRYLDLRMSTFFVAASFKNEGSRNVICGCLREDKRQSVKFSLCEFIRCEMKCDQKISCDFKTPVEFKKRD